MQSNPEIEKAWRIVNHTNKSLFLTGKAGTGKTTFLKKICKDCPKRIVVAAPTGVAAINANGVTLHSLFQLPFAPFIPGTPFSKFETKKFSKNKIKLIRAIDILIIDEISMVRADVLDAIDVVLRRFRNRNVPFGGVQLLMIGDLQQLSPVATNEVWQILRNYYDTPYFFSSKALAEIHFTTVELQEIYRQTDPKFLEILNQVRANQLTPNSLNELNKHYIPYFKPTQGERYVHLTTHNYQAQNINQHELNAIEQPEYSYKAKIKGEFPENIYPTEHELILKLGAQVMFVKNDLSRDKKFYNGMIGEIVEIDNNSFKVRSAENDETIDVEPMTWTNARYVFDEEEQEIKEQELGTFTQFPIKTAWAITIHKSQGLTFSHAIIDAQDSFAHGQVYVALSRCKTLEGLVLSTPLQYRSIITDKQVAYFNQRASSLAPNEVELKKWEEDFFLSKSNELFDFSEIQHALARLLNYIQQHFKNIVPNLLYRYQDMLMVFHQHITLVAERFEQQYSRIFQQVQNPKDSTLQERFVKSTSYFIEQIDPIVDLIEDTNIPTDSKEHKTHLQGFIEDIKNQVTLKQKLLNYVQQYGFDPIEYTKQLVIWSIENDTDDENVGKINKKDKKVDTKQVIAISNDIKYPELYKILTAWRANKAKVMSRPAYTILHQKALIGIVNLLPSTVEELLIVPSVGKVTVEKYGAELLEILGNFKIEEGL